MKTNIKKGDLVHVFIGNENEPNEIIESSEVMGFYDYGIDIKRANSIIPFCPTIFYGMGYTQTQRFIIVRKKWHYYPALIFEKIRLHLPANWLQKIFKNG